MRNYLYKEIKKTVKGQDEAIKQIVTTIWKNHSGEHNSNIIVLGPSGCGKTEILRQTAKLLDIPILMMSVSGMSHTDRTSSTLADGAISTSTGESSPCRSILGTTSSN